MKPFPTRVGDLTEADLPAVEARLEAGERFVLQYGSQSYTPSTLAAIDSLCARFKDALEVRFYRHHESGFDATVLRKLPRVVHLTLDCMDEAAHIEVLQELHHLRHLVLSIERLEDLQLLRHPNLRDLRSLSLACVRSRLDLSHLEAYRQLVSLNVSGHTTAIQAISTLDSLRSLSLWCIPRATSLGFVSALRDHSHLLIGLGGRTDISEVTLPRLQELEITRVQGLSGLSAIERFEMLTTLTIGDQPRLERLEFQPVPSRLHTINIRSCRSLRELHGLEHLSQLRELQLYMTALDPEQVARMPLPAGLENLLFHCGNRRGEQRVREALDARGLKRPSAAIQENRA